MKVPVELSDQVVTFLRGLCPEPRQRLRVALRAFVYQVFSQISRHLHPPSD